MNHFETFRSNIIDYNGKEAKNPFKNNTKNREIKKLNNMIQESEEQTTILNAVHWDTILY